MAPGMMACLPRLTHDATGAILDTERQLLRGLSQRALRTPKLISFRAATVRIHKLQQCPLSVATLSHSMLAISRAPSSKSAPVNGHFQSSKLQQCLLSFANFSYFMLAISISPSSKSAPCRWQLAELQCPFYVILGLSRLRASSSAHFAQRETFNPPLSSCPLLLQWLLA